MVFNLKCSAISSVEKPPPLAAAVRIGVSAGIKGAELEVGPEDAVIAYRKPRTFYAKIGNLHSHLLKSAAQRKAGWKLLRISTDSSRFHRLTLRKMPACVAWLSWQALWKEGALAARGNGGKQLSPLRPGRMEVQLTLPHSSQKQP